jgi:hypothetical protein
MTELPRGDVHSGSPGQPRAAGVGTQAPRGRDAPAYSMWVEEGFAGWSWFAGGLMGLVGIFQVITGIVALAGTGYYTVPSRELVIDAGYTTWGWVHLVLGVVLLVTGGGVALGNTVARVAGVALAGLSAVVNLIFLPAAPFAATLIIALDVFLIFAITVHGGESKRPR